MAGEEQNFVSPSPVLNHVICLHDVRHREVCSGPKVARIPLDSPSQRRLASVISHATTGYEKNV